MHIKKKLLAGLSLCVMLTSANAYELNGDLDVKWTGYKTAKKVGVSGTFNDINLQIEKSDDLATFLKSSKVQISTASFESGLDVRNESIVTTLFSLKSAEKIIGSITTVNTEDKILKLKLTMNEVTKSIPMSYIINDGEIRVKGQIDILDFSMSQSYAKFAKECFNLHEGKSYSEVDIEFTLPYK